MGLLILRNFALLGGYNFANLTKPLVATGALEKDAVLRLHHTLDFWVSVSRTGLDAASKRINACLKTRLVHSASRLYIQKKMPDWETEKFGIPINHADSIATNIAFTVYFLYGLQKLNFKCTTKESQGIFHLWKYNAYLLGLPAAIVPENQAEALQFFNFWTRYQNVPDDDALKLAHALLNENTPVNVLKFDFIKKNMGYVHKSVANFLIDKEFRRRLEIPSVPFGGFIPFVVKLKNQLHKTRRHQIKFGNEEQLSVLRDYKTRAQQQKNHPKL
ncbi:MAG: DUF2236 domain-containing protein [Schleiferiaceae bacterium]|nr:DUF2236 domain-containing protein [Schleiferiaceae bacterium]